MAFPDPESITINAVAKSLPRTGAGLDSGVFTEATGEHKLTFSHAYGKRTRRSVRVDHKKMDADIMDSSLDVPYNMSVQLTVDHPIAGYTVADIKYIIDGLVDYLDASSGAKVTKLLGGES